MSHWGQGRRFCVFLGFLETGCAQHIVRSGLLLYRRGTRMRSYLSTLQGTLGSSDADGRFRLLSLRHRRAVRLASFTPHQRARQMGQVNGAGLSVKTNPYLDVVPSY